MITINYKDIAHLIPEDCIYDGFDNEIVIYHNGDYTTENPIDLDFGEKLDPDYSCKELPAFILINGNLNAKNIYNGETDGSIGLVVLGNLTAENIVVGGQQIYVTGDLNTSGLYWGDYNHGDVLVKGAMNIRVFMETDYGYDIDRFEKGENLHIQHILLDGNEEEYTSSNWIRALFHPQFIFSEEEIYQYEPEVYSWKSWLNTEPIFKALQNGEPLLLPQNEVNLSAFPQPEQIPDLFPNENISYENLQLFGSCNLGTNNENFPENFKFYEYWKDDIFKRIFVNTENTDLTQVYFQKNEEYSVYVAINPSDKKLVLAFTENPFDPNASQLLDLNQHQHYFQFFQEQWKVLQKEVSEAVYFRQKFEESVTREVFDSIMNLPIVKEKYSNYYSDESEYWFGNYCWQFRQNSKEKSARISISIELDNQDFEFFHYEFEGKKTLLYTQDGNGYEFQPYEIPYNETDKYRKAVKIFEILEKNIFRINEGFLKE